MAGRLAIMARPRAGEWLGDEISGWRAEGIDTVISLLEQEEVSELGFNGKQLSVVSVEWNSSVSHPRQGRARVIA